MVTSSFLFSLNLKGRYNIVNSEAFPYKILGLRNNLKVTNLYAIKDPLWFLQIEAYFKRDQCSNKYEGNGCI